MPEQHQTRREFLRGTAAAAAGIAGGIGALRTSPARADISPQFDTSKILNYNPDMEYRRQGKCGWIVSAVGLGGHSRSSLEERRDIIHRCMEVGINYIDACSKGEVVRDAKALEGHREEMYLALSHCGHEVRNEQYRTAKKLLEALDEVLRDSKQEYTDLWRITCFEPGGRHTFNTSLEIVEALTTAKQQGKARAVGFSSHDRRWIQFMIQYFPEIDIVCFPFTTMSTRAPSDSLFPALKKCDVGAFGIKPFAKGSLFIDDPAENDRRARLAIRYILRTNTVIPIPGMMSIHHVDNVAKAVRERRELDLAEAEELERANRQLVAQLPGNYQWLRNWRAV